MGHLQEACCYFRQACTANPGYLQAISNLRNCCSLAVERWHYRMLNDSRRNEAFCSAIKKALTKGDKIVLDIGCGTGILSLFAVEGGANMVYACDGSDTMVHVATQVIESNNASSRVKLINKFSHDLQIPRDIPCRVSLVVMEIFDAGLFGEHVLQTILHAWENLLAPDGEVVPHGAILWVCAIECPYLAARQYVSKSVRHLLKCPAQVVCEQDEPYGCEDVASLPGGFRYVTKPVMACTVDFNDSREVRCLLQSDSDHDVIAQCVQTGIAHAVVTWFTLRLGDQELTTCPGTEHRAECWDQAVFPLPAARRLNLDQQVVFRVCCARGKLSVSISSMSEDSDYDMSAAGSDDGAIEMSSCHEGTVESGRETDQVQRKLETLQLKSFSEAAPSVTCGADIREGYVDESDLEVLTVPQEVVCFLNDQQMVKFLCQVAEMLCNSRSANESSSCLCILDMCPFPLLGVLLASRIQGAKVWCTAQSEAVMRSVSAANGISNEQFKCMAQTELDTLLSSGTQQFDVIIVHLLDPSGKLREAAFLQLPSIRKCLKKDGLFIPRRLTVHGKLVCCDWLDKMSRVLSDNLTCGKKISKFINMYAVPEHCDFHLSAIHHIAYSDPVELIHMELAELPRRKLGTTAYIPLSYTGYVTALPYWYSLTLLEGLRVSTLRDDSHIKQAAVIIRPHMKVQQGRSVQVKTVLEDGFLHITVFPSELSDT